MDYRVLGPVEVRGSEGPVPLGGAKQRALLALLLLNANRVVSRDRLIDDLWGDDPPDTAVTSVQVYVSRLRKLLPESTLLTRAPGYLLAADPTAIDLRRFEALVAEARQADPDRAARTLREALALWRGSPLAEFDEPFARIEARRLEDLRLTALEERIGADLELGRHVDVIGELETLIAEHPHRERLRALLMLALYRCGRQADALEAYRDTRAALDELGIEPSETLRQLEKAILTQDGNLAVAPRLVPGKIVIPGPLATAPPFPFVGRAKELETLRGLFALAESGAGGQVALVGGEPGGGKTRLARELVHDASERGALVLYGASDAVVSAPYQPFVEALEFLVRVCDRNVLKECLGAGGGELTRLLPELARTLGPLPPPTTADPETERHRLHTAVSELLARISRVQPLVLVLDDIQWADASSLRLLSHLARAAPESRALMIATFRERGEDTGVELAGALAALSRLDGVTHVRLDGLSMDEIADFVRHAMNAGPTDELTGALGELTDGIPFLLCEVWRALVDAGTIELSSLGVRVTRPIAEVASPESVRHVVHHRLSRLEPETTAMLEVAAVAGRQFDLSTLGDDGFVASLLEEAIASGMIEEVPGRTLTHRFSHELVRRALYDRLTSVRRAELHDQVGRALERANVTNLDRVVTDLAHHFAFAAPLDGGERAVEYNLRAARAALAAIAYEEAARYFSTALELGLADPGERARVQFELARALWIVGERERAGDTLGDALENARSAGDEKTEWYVRLEQGQWRDPAANEPLAREAVQIFGSLGDDLGLARARRSIAFVARIRCSFAEAELESEQALAHALASGDKQEEVRSVDGVCTALLYGPTPTHAGIARCGELLERAHGSPLTEAVILSSLAGLEAMSDRVEDGRASCRRAHAIYDGLDLPFFIAALAAISGPIELLAGDPVAAEHELRHGLGLLEGLGESDAAAYRSALLARALLAQGKRADAAQALAATEPARLMTRVTHLTVRAQLNNDVGLAREAVELAGTTDSSNLQADARATLADLLLRLGDDEATLQRQTALRLYEEKGNVVAARALLLPESTV